MLVLFCLHAPTPLVAPSAVSIADAIDAISCQGMTPDIYKLKRFLLRMPRDEVNHQVVSNFLGSLQGLSPYIFAFC